MKEENKEIVMNYNRRLDEILSNIGNYSYGELSGIIFDITFDITTHLYENFDFSNVEDIYAYNHIFRYFVDKVSIIERLKDLGKLEIGDE